MATTEGVTIVKPITSCNLRTMWAMDSPEGALMLEDFTTKEMLTIILKTIANNSILASSRTLRISGAMEDRENTQVVVRTSEVEEEQQGSTHLILVTMGVAVGTKTVTGVMAAWTTYTG